MITIEEFVVLYNNQVWVDTDTVEIPDTGINLYGVFVGHVGCIADYATLHLDYESAIEDALWYLKYVFDEDDHTTRSLAQKAIRENGRFELGYSILTIEKLNYLPS